MDYAVEAVILLDVLSIEGNFEYFLVAYRIYIVNQRIDMANKKSKNSKTSKATKTKTAKSKNKSKRCQKGYTLNKKTGKCIWKSVGSKANRSGAYRPSPSESATNFREGHTEIGNSGHVYRVSKASNGVKRWVKA